MSFCYQFVWFFFLKSYKVQGLNNLKVLELYLNILNGERQRSWFFIKKMIYVGIFFCFDFIFYF